MYTFVIVLIILACVLLMLIVLVQNPKGGGLGQTFGGFGNQIMGVQRTTDFLEKATWVLIGAIAVLSLSTFFFLGTPGSPQTGPKSELENVDLGGPALPSNNATPIAEPDTTQ